MSKHAFLPASSAGRWMPCPGSAHMATLYPETTSVNAEEGTLAHELAALEIENAQEPSSGYKKARTAIKKKVDAFYKAHPELDESFDTMAKALEPYIDYVTARFQEAKAKDEAAVLMTEQRVEFGEYVPDGFGTSDVVIIGGGKAIVIDLKYGKGVPVSAVNNPQIRLYSIGAMNAFDLVYDFDEVTGVIYQPRLDSVTEETLTVDDLKAWAAEKVKPAAELAVSENPPYNPGSWCHNYFCPAAGSCKARAKAALAAEEFSDRDPALLSDEELADALTRAELLASWVKDLQSFALSAALDGAAIPGWKVVEGRANRKYKDEGAVAAAAIKAGYNEAMIYEKKLLTLSAMEKLMGKKQFKATLEDAGLVYKPQGSPTLAPESDKRPAFNTANDDFKED